MVFGGMDEFLYTESTIDDVCVKEDIYLVDT